MNIVYFIGNGFDLNVGLNTRYENFYDDLINSKGDEVNPEIAKLRESISKYREGEKTEIDWSDAELGFGKYTSVVKGKDNSDKIVADCHSYFCENLSIYLSKEEKRFQYSKTLRNDSLLAELWTGFTDVSRGLRPTDRNKINGYIANLDGGYNVSVLNFNYTALIDRLISPIEKKKLCGSRAYSRSATYANHINCLHVHGTTDHGLAFGVNDDTQYDQTTFEGGLLEYSRQIVKPLFISDMGEEIQEKAISIINSADIFYIYGMSIGDTDLFWWRLLMNQMIKNKKAILIVHDISVPVIERTPTPYIIDLRIRREKMLSIIPELSDADKKSLSDRIYTTPGNVFDCLENIVDLVAEEGEKGTI